MKGNFHTIRLIALIGAPVIASLTLNAEAANVIAQELKKGSAAPEYFEVTKDQRRYAPRGIQARKTVGKFIFALNHPAPGQQDFEVKKPFIQRDQVEHIWLSDVRFVGTVSRAG